METIADGIGVRDETIITAMRLLHRHAGVVGVAAILEHPALFCDRFVGTIVCGGNLTVEQMHAWL
ncbi:MAG: hypothetical protein ACYDAR_09570 [Thermomicrobiales bacterium]